MAERIHSLQDIIGQYDVVLCDVWGVVHNGIDPFPLACEALLAARRSGVTVVLITNSPRPSAGVVSQFKAIGVGEETYDRIVTSGDVTRELIASQGPKKVFLLGPERDLPLLEGLDVTRVDSEDAEIILCSGLFRDEEENPEDYRDMLAALQTRNLPMICANPDLVVERGTKMIYCAGSLAALYRELGGETLIAGKPFSPIYDACLAKAEVMRGAFSRDRVLAIGDGMPTDVRGAINQDLDLLYISGGIHAGEYVRDGATDEAALSAFLTCNAAAPKWWMPKLA